MAVLEAEAITKEYPTRSGALSVLRGCSLTLDAGESAAIVGPSGCGKSTLLNILGALEPPTAGNVQIGGQNAFELKDNELAAFRNRRIGFIFQDHHLLPQCNALENVLIPTLVREDGQELTRKAHDLLDRVGLGDRLDHLPSELSGGERQRVAIARALIQNPAIVLADEPTGNLDARSADAVGEMLLELTRSERVVLITVTHSAALAGRFQRCYRIDDGKLIPTS
jgi:lipoprotein-releasing system ATP-binding protein